MVKVYNGKRKNGWGLTRIGTRAYLEAHWAIPIEETGREVPDHQVTPGGLWALDGAQEAVDFGIHSVLLPPAEEDPGRQRIAVGRIATPLDVDPAVSHLQFKEAHGCPAQSWEE